MSLQAYKVPPVTRTDSQERYTSNGCCAPGLCDKGDDDQEGDVQRPMHDGHHPQEGDSTNVCGNG